MKDLYIRPGVVLMVTNVRVMLRLDPQDPSHLQRHVYLSSTAESQVNIWTSSVSKLAFYVICFNDFSSLNKVVARAENRKIKSSPSELGLVAQGLKKYRGSYMSAHVLLSPDEVEVI